MIGNLSSMRLISLLWIVHSRGLERQQAFQPGRSQNLVRWGREGQDEVTHILIVTDCHGPGTLHDAFHSGRGSQTFVPGEPDRRRPNKRTLCDNRSVLVCAGRRAPRSSVPQGIPDMTTRWERRYLEPISAKDPRTLSGSQKKANRMRGTFDGRYSCVEHTPTVPEPPDK